MELSGQLSFTIYHTLEVHPCPQNSSNHHSKHLHLDLLNTKLFQYYTTVLDRMLDSK